MNRLTAVILTCGALAFGAAAACDPDRAPERERTPERTPEQNEMPDRMPDNGDAPYAINNQVAQDAVVQGEIVSVDLDEMVFSIRTDEEYENIEISVSEDTAFTLDGAESTMEDALEAGRFARVTHEEKVASRVEVSSEDRPR